MQPGQCTLPPNASGRILDRSAALEQIISSGAVCQALAATGRADQRRCKLTHEVVCWVVLKDRIRTFLDTDVAGVIWERQSSTFCAFCFGNQISRSVPGLAKPDIQADKSSANLWNRPEVALENG
jgi:hypothetical protein